MHLKPCLPTRALICVLLWQNVAELRKKIDEEQRMLMQFAEERLALAQSLLGLLELHVTQANKDISSFEIELQVCRVTCLCSCRIGTKYQVQLSKSLSAE